MFNKLIRNLPFNPSLINEVAFYAKRMRSESSIRRTGLIFIVLAMLIQVFAIVSPPQPTLAESNNDILRGGITSREQATNYCRTNTQGFADILSYHGISCDVVSSSSIKAVKSTDYNRQLRSMGRVPQGSVIARTGKPTNETRVSIKNKSYYMRNLWAWDGYSTSTYKMLAMKNNQGKSIFIMFNCGNIVTIGHYSPPAPKPTPQPSPSTKPKPQIDTCQNIPGIQHTTDECDTCPNLPGIQTNKDQCYPCPNAENDTSITACLEMTKTAENLTQKIPDANGTIAEANDVIVYTLTTRNKGNQAVDFIVEENLSDVLEYSNVTDLDGGSLDSQNIVQWPKVDIPANSEIIRKITVRIKDPIPQTPTSSSDPGSHDLVMTNVYYGNSINIELTASISKNTELIVSSLPQTGPGTTLVVGFTLTAFFSYFLARSRLIATEMEIVKSEFISSGGL